MLTLIEQPRAKRVGATGRHRFHATLFVVTFWRHSPLARVGEGALGSASRRRFLKHSAGLAMLGLPLAGCTAKYTPLYVRDADGQLQAAWRTCHLGGGIGDLSLYAGTGDGVTTHASPLWKITATGGADASAVTIGATPPGFVVEVALNGKLLPGNSYTLVANATSKQSVYGVVSFKPDQVSQGSVVFDKGRVQSVDAYNKRSGSAFGCG